MKILYHTVENKLLTYPRSDGEPMIGLTPNIKVLEIIEINEQISDPTTQTSYKVEEVDLQALTLTRGYRVRNYTSNELTNIRRMLFKDAETYQVREWLIRSGQEPDTLVNSVIDIVFTDPIENAVQKDRWSYVTRIPRDHPLVNTVGQIMNLTSSDIDELWDTITKI